MLKMLVFYPILGLIFFSNRALASAGEETAFVHELLVLVLIIGGAKLAGFILRRLNQPSVLGELLFGIVLGNLPLWGFHSFSFMMDHKIFNFMANLGVVLLLFEVGVESDLKELLKVGKAAVLVAMIGTFVPMVLGFFVSFYFFQDRSFYTHLFVGATLCATSVGITARVLKDLGKIQTKEAKIILGAAVLDDILGLVILALVGGMVLNAESSGIGFSWAEIFWVSFRACAFLCLVLIARPFVQRFFGWAKVFFGQEEGILFMFALGFCFVSSYFSTLFGLAPIVGAFSAGLVLDLSQKNIASLSPHQEISSFARFFVPVFFVHMGMQVNLRALFDSSVLIFGLALTVVAILGKQSCSLVLWGKEHRRTNKLLVGLGMIPRGEVGLIFAAYGAKLVFQGSPVIDGAMYSAMVCMVLLTTMVTPPALKWASERKN